MSHMQASNGVELRNTHYACIWRMTPFHSSEVCLKSLTNCKWRTCSRSSYTV